MPRDDFFDASYCQRCGKDTGCFIMSWFMYKRICLECQEVETALKAKLKEQGKDPADFEGCGYIPKIAE
jgi:hypothetical protein